MASAIDPTKPADGIAAEKTDLRANLLAAKNEIEALQAALGAQGAVVYPEDFGAVPNRTTECAAAINSAIQAASTYTVAGQLRGGRVQLSKGDYRISQTIQLRSLTDLVGISPTATTLWVPPSTAIRAVQTFNTDQILFGLRRLGIYGNAASQAADNGSGTLTGAIGSDTGGVYLLNAKAEPSAIGEYQFLGGNRAWAQDLLIQEVGGNGFVCQGNSGWIVDHIHVRWARRYGLYLDTNDGSFEQMIASRTGWAGMFVDGASNRVSNVKVWFNGVEMDRWLLAKTWTATNDATANARQFSTNQKAGVGVLVRGDRNRIWLTDVQDTAGHGAYIHGRFNWLSLTLDQVGQVNAGGTTTRYDGGGAGANDWVDLNPGQPLVGVFVQQNQRGTLEAFVHDLNYNNDGTPGGSVLHHALQHMVLNQEVDLTLDVYGHQEIMAQRVPPTAPVVSSSPYTLNGVSSVAATITIDSNEVLARTAAGSGVASGFGSAEIAEDTTPASGDYLLGWDNLGVLKRFNVGNLPAGASLTVAQNEVVGRTTTGSGAPTGLGSSEVTEETSPASGDFLLGWESAGALRRFNIGNLPSGGTFSANTTFGAGRTGENNRTLNQRIQDLVNVKDFGAVGDGVTNDRVSINEAIVYCNTLAGTGAVATHVTLEFPGGRYIVTGGTLTPAEGNYSIIMHPGAIIEYTPSVVNAVMWTIGSADANGSSTIDGLGILHFELAAECANAGGAQYGQVNNVAFEFINISHFTIEIRAAIEWNTGLRMTADATSDGDKHQYDVDVHLGFFHPCFRHVVQQTIAGGWMNNIRYYGGDFSPAQNGSRYINMLTQGTVGNVNRGGENKATFYEPLCDGHSFTAMYVRGATAMAYGGHMENPNNSGAFPGGFVIEHEAGQINFQGDEPCVWIAPRLEAKQFLVSDPDDIGSYCYDPFWGPGPKPRLKALTGSRNLTTGDVRSGRMLYNPGSSNWQVTIPDFGGGAQEPPLMAEVHFARHSTGTLTIAAGSGAALLLPVGKTAPVGVLQGGLATARLINLDSGGNQLWHVTGDFV